MRQVFDMPSNPVEYALLMKLCSTLLKGLEAQDVNSAARWGVRQTAPVPGGTYYDYTEPLGVMCGGIALYCLDRKAKGDDGWVVVIYLGEDTMLRIDLIPAMRYGIDLDFVREEGSQVRPLTICHPNDMTTTIDRLINEFRETCNETI